MFDSYYIADNQRIGENAVDFTRLSDEEIDRAIHHIDDEPVAFDPFSLFAARLNMMQT